MGMNLKGILRHIVPTVAMTLLLASCIETLPAQDGASTGTVAARIGEEQIYVSEVKRMVKSAVGRRTVASQAEPLLEAQMLDQLVKRHLVLSFLQKEGLGATTQEVDEAIEQFAAKLARQDKQLESFLKQQGITREYLRRQAAWQLGWKKYVASQASDARLASFFSEHRREFDGTELEVSHILLRPERSGDAQGLSELMDQARQLRGQILAGDISFEEAAKTYSWGPSRKQGGNLGRIARHGAMVDAFSQAAFALAPGEISPPVATKFGVHLIRCEEEFAGEKSWQDVRKELTEAYAKHLFRELAARLTKEVPVQYTGAAPYLDPGTNKLVVPRR